jgi:chromosome segregation ATPase
VSSDESFIRLQNALATLAEMVVRSQEVDAQHEARINSLEESNRRITQTNRDLAEANRLIVELIRRHDERLDEFRAARDETEHKLAALIDAQIRGEESMEKLRAEQAHAAQKIAELAESQARLAEAQARTEAAVERLSQTVQTILRDGRGGQSPG